ncbi:hypothetical protein ES703_25447 [subsurface metagenome]
MFFRGVGIDAVARAAASAAQADATTAIADAATAQAAAEAAQADATTAIASAGTAEAAAEAAQADATTAIADASAALAAKRARIKTGVYTGNSVDNRNIDIGVDLAGKDNSFVTVAELGTSPIVWRIEYGQGDLSMFDDVTDQSDYIQQFTVTGFQVGASSGINNNGVTYRYIAFWEEP